MTKHRTTTLMPNKVKTENVNLIKNITKTIILFKLHKNSTALYTLLSVFYWCILFPVPHLQIQSI